MPIHAVAGHLAVMVAPLAALMSLVYAVRPAARRGMRLPLVVTVVLAMGLTVWAGQAGGDLLAELERGAETAGTVLPASVETHAKGSDALSVAVWVLGAAVLGVVWRSLAPGRPPGRGRAGRALLVVSGLAVFVTTGTVLAQAMAAVWATQDLWSR